MDPSKETTEAVFKVLKADKPNQVRVDRLRGSLYFLMLDFSRVGTAGLASRHGAQQRLACTYVLTALACIGIWVFT